MVDMKSLLRFFDRDFVVKTLLTLLLISLLLLADGFVLVVLSRLYGVFFMLAIEATVSLIGCAVVIDAINRQLARLRNKIREGVYPNVEYCHVAAALLAGLLIVVPGFVSDVVGFLVLVPGLRYLVGLGLTLPLRGQLRQAYEYLKMHEFEESAE